MVMVLLKLFLNLSLENCCQNASISKEVEGEALAKYSMVLTLALVEVPPGPNTL